MDDPRSGGPALLLDPPTGGPNLQLVDLTDVHEAPGRNGPVIRPPSPAGVGFESLFRSPGLAVLAGVLLLEGYRWLGVIPADDSGLSVVFGRVGTGLFAVVFAVAAVSLTHPAPGARRSSGQRLVVAATGVVVVASFVLVVSGAPAAARLLGVLDVIAAVVVAAVFTVGEWRHRRPTAADVPTGPGH